MLLWRFRAGRGSARDARHHRRLRSLVQKASGPVLVVDDAGLIVECTPALEAMLGRRAGDLRATPLWTIVHPADEVPLATTGVVCSWRAEHADGTWVDVESTHTDLVEDASLAGTLLVVRDVRARKAFEQGLHHAAFHDALTGLPDRTLFDDRLRHALALARRSGQSIAVLRVQVDDLRAVNDARGRQVGDEVLRLTAARLDACLRGADTAARTGGDEFAVLLERVTGPAHVDRVANRLRDALGRPFVIGGEELAVRTSIRRRTHEPAWFGGVSWVDHERVDEPRADDARA